MNKKITARSYHTDGKDNIQHSGSTNMSVANANDDDMVIVHIIQ